MATYSYQARDESGRLVKGILDADSKVLLADRLRKMGYLVVKVEEGSRLAFKDVGRIRFGRLVSPDDLLMVMVELANLIEAGIPLVSALSSVAEQYKPGPLRQALEAAAKDIEGGKSFSESLARHPRIFPKLLVGTVSVGEASGKLDVVLQRFAFFLEKDLALRQSIQSALAYPIFLLLTSLFLVMYVVTFVVPKFSSFFSEAGISLPLLTRIVAGAGEWIKSHGLLLALLALSGFAAAGWILNRPAVKGWLDEALLKVPVVGKMAGQALVARLTRCLSTLVGSGIPILTALETAAGTAGNQAATRELLRARLAVEGGERISVALSMGSLFHPDVVQMIRAGEDSGRLDIMLDKVADFYDRRVGFALKQLTTLLEPLLLVGLGIVIAFIMASLLLPMLDLVKVMRRGGM